MFLAPQLSNYIFDMLFSNERSAGNKLLGLRQVSTSLNGVTLSFALSGLKIALELKIRGGRYQVPVHQGRLVLVGYPYAN
jgi:hypothetical protein